MDSKTTVPVKFRLAENSCRRARLEIPLSMSEVTRKLSACFPELKPGQFSIQYQDEEGEQIEVVNDADLAEAVAVFEAIGRVISLSILPRSIETGESDESSESDPEENPWRNHFRKHNGRHHGHHIGHHGHHIGRGRRWHALAHMLGMRPCDMKPKMRKMMRFGMLKHFFNNDNTDACVETCDLQCTFVSDVTFADGTAMKPKQSFNKKWLVKTGTKSWPAGCSLVHVGGHPMGSRRPRHPKFTLGVVPPNSEVEVMVVLQSPKRARDFVSKWRMCTPDGVLFGECLWASIRVEATATTPADEPIDLECKFVADDSIPDGTTMKPHEKFEKKWVVKTGETKWPAGCMLVHVSGHGMGTKRPKFKPAPLGEVSANSKIVLKATMQAPKRTNNFVSKWRMCTPDGRQFGDYLWTFINVEETASMAANDANLQCKFLADGTIPDRSLVPPKNTFEKKWIVKTGPKPWPAGCVLTHVGGHAMGTKHHKAKPAPLGPVPANSELELVLGLRAPKPARDFVSKWRMCTPDGRPFGDFLWALITVDPNAPPVKSISTPAVENPPAVPVAAAANPAPAVTAKPVVVAAAANPAPAVAAKPVPVDANPAPAVAAKPVPVDANPAPVSTTVPVPIASEHPDKLQQLLELNFPVPVEVLACVLESAGGDLNQAITLLLTQ